MGNESKTSLRDMIQGALRDSYGRTVKDLRLSVTDRCNYRCFYCKPLGGMSERYSPGIATYEEFARITRLFAAMGVNKVRVTGGEPLLRRELEVLIRELAAIPGVDDLAMTTNAFFLPTKAKLLKEAGLQRLTISLDSLRRERFHEITGSDSLHKVMKGIEAAEEAGFGRMKINVVVTKGVNDDEIIDFAKYSRETGHIVRFIEFMPLDADKSWSKDKVVTQAEILEQLAQLGPLEPIEKSDFSETANKFRYADGKGEIGIIASVTAAFCGHCSRIRLTADGKLRTCLFSEGEYDLLKDIREGSSDEQLNEIIRQVVWKKEAGHKINEPDYHYPNRSMSFIGG